MTASLSLVADPVHCHVQSGSVNKGKRRRSVQQLSLAAKAAAGSAVRQLPPLAGAPNAVGGIGLRRVPSGSGDDIGSCCGSAQVCLQFSACACIFLQAFQCNNSAAIQDQPVAVRGRRVNCGCYCWDSTRPGQWFTSSPPLRGLMLVPSSAPRRTRRWTREKVAGSRSAKAGAQPRVLSWWVSSPSRRPGILMASSL